MLTEFTGKAWVFGDNIDTDQITPAQYLTLITPEELGPHCLEGADPEFAGRVQKGDLIVAGQAFGSGSSREHAPVSILGAGVAVVVAESFARIFFRNAINVGLPLIECPGVTDSITTGDKIKVNLATGEVSNLTTTTTLQGQHLPPNIQEILEAGGLVEMVRRELESRAASG